MVLARASPQSIAPVAGPYSMSSFDGWVRLCHELQKITVGVELVWSKLITGAGVDVDNVGVGHADTVCPPKHRGPPLTLTREVIRTIDVAKLIRKVNEPHVEVVHVDDVQPQECCTYDRGMTDVMSVVVRQVHMCGC